MEYIAQNILYGARKNVRMDKGQNGLIIFWFWPMKHVENLIGQNPKKDAHIEFLFY